MASPGIRPPRPRSIAGPIVLILLGILFLAGTMGVLNWHSLALAFARYWPALLILWGVIKIIEYQQAKNTGVPARGITAGGVFLVLFIICTGLIATQAARVNWNRFGENVQIGDEDWENWFGGSTYSYSDELDREIPAGASLHINDDRGTINVTVADSRTVKVSVRKKLRADRQNEADTYNSKTKPQIMFADKIVTLDANTKGAGDKGVITDMDVSVPRNTELVITGRRGNVMVTGMVGSLEINHQNGEVTVNDHTGNVNVRLERGNLGRGSIRLSEIKGDVTVQGKTDEVAVEDVTGAVHLNGEFQESVRLARISKTVGFRSARTDMEFSRLDGRLDLDSGDLRADSIAGPMRLTTRSKDINLEGLSGDLRLQNENGTVAVSLHKPGNIQIDNKGDVEIAIPPSTGVKVEARVRNGDIQTDFNELKVTTGENQASANGSIGSNGPKLAINSENGTIEIRKGAVAAPAAPPAPPSPSKAGKSLPAPPAAPEESEN